MAEVFFLSQTFDSILEKEVCFPWELVIVLDRPSRESVDSVEQAMCEYVKLTEVKVGGSAHAAQAGLLAAKYDLVAVAHADDISLPLRFTKQHDFMRKNPKVVCVGTQLELIDENDEHIAFTKYPTNVDAVRSTFKFKSVVAHPAAMFRKEVAIAAGGLRQSYAPAEDYDLWVRMLKYGEIANLDEVLLKYRRHLNQTSRVSLHSQVNSKTKIVMENYFPSSTLRENALRTKVLKTRSFFSKIILTRAADFFQSNRKLRALLDAYQRHLPTELVIFVPHRLRIHVFTQ